MALTAPKEARMYESRSRWMSCLVLASLLGACVEEPIPAPEVLRPVRTITVALASGVKVATFAGAARAGVESRLSFRVGGTVDAVRVNLGDRVRRGQVLARLDPADYDLEVGKARAGLAQAEAALRQAQADYERVRLLYENNNAAKSDLDAGRAGAESAAAQVESGSKQLAQARRQVGYAMLRAPRDGSIAAVEIEANETVQAGSVAFLLTSGSHPEVALAVPEVLIAEVTAGQSVRVEFDALPDRVFAATVTEVGVAATAAATTFAATVRLDEPTAEVRAGMAADVNFRFEHPERSAIFVPLVAVGEDSEGRFAFVLEADSDGTGVVRRRAVTVGELTGEGLEVTSGLTVGEVVVTAGVRRLGDGQRVLASAETAG